MIYKGPKVPTNLFIFPNYKNLSYYFNSYIKHYMEEHKAIIEEVNIDEAINITAGTRKYQKIMILILLLGPFSISPFLNCSDFFLPESSDSWFKDSASDELAPLPDNSNKRNAFRNFFFGGWIIGCLIIPVLADKYGRKKVIKKCLILGTISMVIAAFSINMVMMCIAGFFIGALYAHSYLIGFILCMESLDFKHRNYYLGVFQMAWPISGAFFIALYWLDLYWRYNMLISAGILIMELFLFAYLEESLILTD